MNTPKRKSRKERPVWLGAPGNYALNRHSPRYADRRTKRNRSRSEMRRKAITDAAS